MPCGTIEVKTRSRSRDDIEFHSLTVGGPTGRLLRRDRRREWRPPDRLDRRIDPGGGAGGIDPGGGSGIPRGPTE